MGFFMKNIGISIFILLSLFISTNLLYANNYNNDNEGYILLNLHWAEGKISLNSMKKVIGFKKGVGRKSKTQPFFYTILSEDGETIRANYFKIPKKLYFDYFDESTAELKGGQLEREEFDFVIRVPYFDKMKQIMIYKLDIASHFPTKKMILEKSADWELIGKINF